MKAHALKELFDKGYGFKVFQGHNNNPNSLKVQSILESIELDEEVKDKLDALKKNHYVICLGENWCPDCTINETIMHKVGEYQPLIQIKHLPREGYESLVSSFDPDGKARIPLILLMDDTFNLMGTFNEVPKIVHKAMASGDQTQVIVAKRKYRNGEFLKETCLEFIEIFERSE